METNECSADEAGTRPIHADDWVNRTVYADDDVYYYVTFAPPKRASLPKRLLRRLSGVASCRYRLKRAMRALLGKEEGEC